MFSAGTGTKTPSLHGKMSLPSTFSYKALASQHNPECSRSEHNRFYTSEISETNL